MKQEDLQKAKWTLIGYFTSHALIDIMLEGLVDDREDVELWAMNCLREYGRLRKKHNAGKLTDYELMLEYIQYLENLSGIAN